MYHVLICHHWVILKPTPIPCANIRRNRRICDNGSGWVYNYTTLKPVTGQTNISESRWGKIIHPRKKDRKIPGIAEMAGNHDVIEDEIWETKDFTRDKGQVTREKGLAKEDHHDEVLPNTKAYSLLSEGNNFLYSHIGFGICTKNNRMLFHGLIVFFLSQIYFRPPIGSTQIFVEMPILLTNRTSYGSLARGML